MPTRLIPVDDANPNAFANAAVAAASLATNDVAFDAVATDQALSPANFNFIHSAIVPKLKVADTDSERVTKINAAIEESCGGGNPVTTTRIAARGVEVPSGEWLTNSPILVRSVIGLDLRGKGECAIVANANMTSILDINGMAYSNLGEFTIKGFPGVQVDNAIYVYWNNAGAQRSTTINQIEKVVVRNLDFVTGIRMGEASSSTQVDNDVIRDCAVTGAWTTGEASRYQNAILLGTTVSANNLLHKLDNVTLGHSRYLIRVDNTQVEVSKAGLDGCEVALWCQSSGYSKFGQLDVEEAEVLFFSPSSAANANVTIENVFYRAQDLIADGKWIDHNMAGVLLLKNLCINLAPVTPIIETGSNPCRVEVEGLSVRAVGDPAAAACFAPGASTIVRVRGFVSIANATGAVASVTDYNSDGDIGHKVDVYTSGTTTWTKPTWATTVTIAAIGGAGGGGSGRRGAAATVRCGGGGGGGAGWSIHNYSASDLPATLSVTVGAAGTGGAAVTTDDTNGATGGNGGSTLILSGAAVYGRGSGGLGGGGGTNAAGTGGAGGTSQFLGGAGGAASATGLLGATGTSAAAGGGGGSGGGITSADVASAGGNAGLSNTRSGSNAPTGGAIGTAGQSSNGAPTPTASAFPGHAGGGGGSSITGAAGAGGAGALAGGGGGGGGASLNGNNSGAGGAGAAGIVVITSYG